MSVPLGVAAHLVGRNDPDHYARPLVGLRGVDLRAAAAVAQLTARQVEDAGDDAGALPPLVRAGWSNAAPQRALQAFRDACGQVAADLTARALAIDGAAETIEASQAEVSEVIGEGQHFLDCLLSATAPEVTELLAQEQLLLAPNMTIAAQHLVDDVCAEIQGLVERARTALAGAAARLREDPAEVVLRLWRDGALPAGTPGGSPVWTGDTANRAALFGDLDATDTVTATMASGVHRALGQVAAAGVTAQLVSYEAASGARQGRVAVAVGDLSSAEHIVVLVPGITSSPATIADEVPAALDLTAAMAKAAQDPHTATVLWYGYDIPVSWAGDGVLPTSFDGVGVIASDTAAAADAANARAGGEALARDTARIAAMAPTGAAITLAGFSMGSTTVSEAGRFDLPVRNLVLMGSPGAGWDAQTAADYRSVPADRVFVLASDGDLVTNWRMDVLAALSGIAMKKRFGTPFGPDPARAAFGAQRIAAPTMPKLPKTAFSLHPGLSLDDHSLTNYLGNGAVAEIGAGHSERAPTVPGR